MKKGINYWAFPSQPDGNPKNIIEAMREARALGFDCFEVTVENRGQVTLASTQGDIELIRAEADKIGISLYTLAALFPWNCSPTDPDPHIRDKAVLCYQKTIEIAHWLGVETVLYIPGMVSAVFVPTFKPQPYDLVDSWAHESLKRVLQTANELNVKIGVENVWNRYLLSPLEMCHFIDSFHSPLVGSYFDVGNVMLLGHPEHWVSILGKRIFAIHLKDFRVNIGNLDGFTDLLSGDVDFPAVMSACREISFNGPFTVELVPGRIGAVEKASAAIRIIEKM